MYEVTVEAGDGSLKSSLSVAVTVTNVDESGTVSLSSTSAKEGTAVTATLSDPDGGIAGASWQWQRRARATDTWRGISSAASSSYTPVAGDVGYMLRATVGYIDGHGSGKSAHSGATAAVVGRPGRPGSLSATAGDRQVSLSWTAAAANGSSITRYEHRRIDALPSGSSGGTRSTSSWSTVSGGASARSQRVSGLTNGASYTFQVRAVNGVGSGPAASVSARPQVAKPAKPTGLTATGGDSQVSLSWDNPNNSSISQWHYRRKTSGGNWGTSQTISGSGASTTSHTVRGLLDLTSYSFQVRAKNAGGEGPWSDEASATTRLPFRRSSNHPNPFNAETLLRYAVPEAQRVRLAIYDILGRPVRILVDEVRPMGVHEIVWDGRDSRGRSVASGVYLYRFQTPDFSQTRKMILLR